MIQEFLGETLISIRLFFTKVGEDLYREVAFLFVILILYGSLRLALRMLSGKADERLTSLARLGTLIVGYSFLYFLYKRDPGLNVLLLLQAVVYTDILLSLFDVLKTVLRPGRLTSISGKFLIFLSGVLIFLQNVASPEILPFYLRGFKFTVALLLTFVLFDSYNLLTERVEKRILNRFLKRIKPFLFLIYFALTLAWVFGTVTLSQTFLIKLSALIGVLTALVTFQVYALSKLELLLGKDFKTLREDLRRFLSLVAIFVLYRGLDALFDLTPILNVLGNMYLIKTELVKISVLSIAESLYVFLFLWYLTALVKDSVYTYYIRKGREIEAGSFRAFISNLGILLAVIVALINLGLTWKVMVPVAGALGIGLGFGLQTIFNNYVSGFILLLSRNIKVGDLVEIEGTAGETLGRSGETIFGKVVNINVLTTVIRTNDNFEIAIPNSEFISGRIVNYSLSDPFIRLRIPFGVSYSSDPKKVKEILLKVAREFDAVLEDPPPKVWFYEMGDSALIFYLLVWIDIRKFWRIRGLRSELYFRVWDEFKKEGIEIPFPQRDVWFKNSLRVELDEGSLSRKSSERGKEGF